MSAKERGQEMETLPGAQKSGHNTCTVVDAGGSWHVVAPSGDSTHLCVCSKGHACLDTFGARSCNYRDSSNSLERCVRSLY